MNRIGILSSVLRGRGTYLEIGVRGGRTFWAIKATTKVGVDPAFLGRKFKALVPATQLAFKLGLRRGTFCFPEPSDDFFANHVERMLAGRRFNAALVDGLHTGDQAYRDVDNTLQWAADDAVIVMHDCNPPSKTAQLPTVEEARAQPDFCGGWNGDVWRAVLRLRARDDVVVETLDSDCGLGIVRKGRPTDILKLSESEIAAMPYETFDEDRRQLLNLQPG